MPLSTDVHVTHHEGVQRPEAIVGDPQGHDPWPQVLVGIDPIVVLGTSWLIRGVHKCLHRPTYMSVHLHGVQRLEATTRDHPRRVCPRPNMSRADRP